MAAICCVSSARARGFAACSGVSASACQTLAYVLALLICDPSSFRGIGPSQAQVALRCALRLLLKRVQHEYGVGKPGGVDHPIIPRVVPCPDLLDAAAYGRHRPEAAPLPTPRPLIEPANVIVAGHASDASGPACATAPRLRHGAAARWPCARWPGRDAATTIAASRRVAAIADQSRPLRATPTRAGAQRFGRRSVDRDVLARLGGGV